MSASLERARAALDAHKRRMRTELVMLGVVCLLGLRVATSGVLPRGVGIALVLGTGLLAVRAVRAYTAKNRELAPPRAGDAGDDAPDNTSRNLMMIYVGVLVFVAAFIYVMGILFAPNAR